MPSAALDCDTSTLRPIFVYGSLMSPVVFKRATRGMEPLERLEGAQVHGFRRVRVKGAPYPAAISDSSPTAKLILIGHLVTLQSLQDVHVLDEFESDLYIRQTVSVTLPDGSVREADIYLWNKDISMLSLDEEWTLEVFESQGHHNSNLWDPS